MATPTQPTTTALAILIERLQEHYPYELVMLRATYAYLVSGRHSQDRILTNALIESFCTHARLLIEFFEGKGGVITKYVDAGFAPLNRNNNPQLDRLCIMLNNQVAHLVNDLRTSDREKKIGDSERTELLELLAAKSEEFRNHLDHQYASLNVPAIDKTNVPKPVKGPGSSTGLATTTTTTSESVNVITFTGSAQC